MLKFNVSKIIAYSGLIVVFYMSIFDSNLQGLVPGHHGWVLSEQLAIIMRSSVENGFTGYRFLLNNEPSYFSKMSFIFNGIMHFLIYDVNVSNSFNMAMHIMNVIFITILFLSYKLVHMYTKNWMAAILSVLFGGAGTLSAYYYDLPSPDIFLTLSFLISSFSIYFIFKEKFKTALLLAAVSVIFGFVLVNTIPFIVAFFILLFDVYLKRINKIFFMKASLIIFISGALSTSFFVYNIYQETEIRNVKLTETDVYKSFTKRAGGYSNEYYDAHLKGRVELENYIPNFLHVFSERILTPHYVKNYHKLIFSVLILAIAYNLLKRKSHNDNHAINTALFVALISSSYTLFMFKAYVTIHDFGRLSLIISSIIIWGIVFSRVNKLTFFPLLVIGLFLFESSYSFHNERKNIKALNQKIEIKDFDRINNYLTDKNSSIYIDVEGGHRRLFRRAPYSLGLFLSEVNIVTEIKSANYIISKKKEEGTLTLNNETLFLYRIKQ